MSGSTYHVRKISVGVKRKYRLYADDGAGRPGDVLGYAEKKLTMSDEIVLYRDQERTHRLAVVRESSAGFLAALSGYEAFDPAGGRLGSFGVLIGKSVHRTTWEFVQPGRSRMTGTERSVRTARLRRLIALGGGTAGGIVNAVTKYHFDFTLEDDPVFGDDPVFSIDKPKVLDDWYRITVHDTSIDPNLLFALTVTMEARQRG